MSAADELTAGLRAELDRVNDRLAEPLLDLRQEAWKKIGESTQQDIPDLIAGALGVSRGTAYDMMREALAEQAAQSTADKSELETVPAKGGLLPAQQEPVTWGVDWGKAGDIPCVSIIKRLPDGGIEVMACEYAPYTYATPPAPAQPLADELWGLLDAVQNELNRRAIPEAWLLMAHKAGRAYIEAKGAKGGAA